jgi:rfaE bifunctional protein nucleotidyltransferase chain/domain
VGKVVDLDTLKRELAGADHRVVTTNGCFDLLHVGHLRLMEAARGLGDVLVVLVNDDASVASIKGPGRPLVPDAQRAELVAGLCPVDYVVLFSEDTPVRALAEIRPDVHVKGGDYRPEDLPEAQVLSEAGAEIVIFPLVEGLSTTRIAERLVD